MREIVRYIIKIMVFLFILTYQNTAFAPIGGARGILPTKETFNKAELVCAGEIKDIIDIKADEVEVYGRIIKGHWKVAQISVDNSIKGELPSNTIELQFFFPDVSMERIYFEIPFEGKRYLFFLKKDGVKYELLTRGGCLVELPINPSTGLDKIKEPLERLQLELFSAIRTKDTEIASNAIKVLSSLGIYNPEVSKILKEVSKLENPIIAVQAIASRIKFDDPSAFSEAQHFCESPFYLQSRPGGLILAIERVKNQDRIPDLIRFSRSKTTDLRRVAVYALRQMDNDFLVPVYVSLLEDEDDDVRYHAIMGIARQTDVTPVEWATNVEAFEKNPEYYVKKCQDWWEKEGNTRYPSLEAALKHFNVEK